jgi:hypothetical protein
MGFTFRELDTTVRQLMVAEINNAISTGTLYYSKRFNESGIEAWSGLLLQAAQSHDEHWLAYSLEMIAAIKGYEIKAKPKGGYTQAHVPDTAAETLADAEFNRYYMCAVCRKALAEGKSFVTVYRAKFRGEPRAESQALIGSTFEPASLIEELRPNSGLSVHS